MGSACSGGDSSSASVESGEVVVFAASSLTEAFTEIGAAFERDNPSTHVTLNFSGSAELAAQIIEGAPADVYVPADDANLAKLADAGHHNGAAVRIARNTFAIIVERGSPLAIDSLADLADSDVLVVVCAPTVPCGAGAAQIFANADVDVIAKSYEQKVKGVVGKVMAGEADAGIVFVTDVIAAGDRVASVAIPADVNVITNYSMVRTTQAAHPRSAQAFIDFVSGDIGQAILAAHGFLAP